MIDNLFSVLDKRKHEDYLTEAFVNVLKRLQQEQPDFAATLISNLCGGRISFTESEVRDLSISTQKSLTNRSRPDITITGLRCLVHIEVKRSGPIAGEHTNRQLEHYLADLDEHIHVEHRQVVLLAHSVPKISKNVTGNALFSDTVYWYEVGDWLKDGRCESLSEVSRFVLSEFISFLKERGLAMTVIDRSMIGGAKALMNFHNLTSAVLREHLDNIDTITWYDPGIKHAFKSAGLDCEVILHWDEPDSLAFYAEVPGSKQRVKYLDGLGWEIYADDPTWMRRKMNFEECEFFVEDSSAKQHSILSDFIVSCLDDLKKGKSK